jgi:hypothetical protein
MTGRTRLPWAGLLAAATTAALLGAPAILAGVTVFPVD